MEPALRATAGLALAGLGHFAWAGVFSTFGPDTRMLAAGFGIAGLGLLVAAAGLASLTRGRGLRTLAAGFGLALAPYVAMAAEALSGGGLYKVGFAVIVLGLAQGLWYTALWSVDRLGAPERRLAPLRLSLAVMAAGAAWFLLLNLTDGSSAVAVGSLPTAIGLALAARELRGVVPARPEELTRLGRRGDLDPAALQAPLPGEAPRERIR